MHIEENGRDLVLSEVEDFDLGQTLECGQCFHFYKIDERDYCLNAREKFLHVKQYDDKSVKFYNTNKDTFNGIWRDYFDFDTDYGRIKSELLCKDTRLKSAMDTMWGIHILNQDFFETLISFIISQNKQIPHIKKIVGDISVRYGAYNATTNDLMDDEGNQLENSVIETLKQCGVCNSFPGVESLITAGVDGMRECKTGFRAPYIMDACNYLKNGDLRADEIKGLDYDESIDKLMKIKGVGSKVANCVALFGLGKRNAFPVDVWIKRTMEEVYVGHELPKEEISKLAKELFGEYGGYAQQYLFHYARSMSLQNNFENKRKRK